MSQKEKTRLNSGIDDMTIQSIINELSQKKISLNKDSHKESDCANDINAILINALLTVICDESASNEITKNRVAALYRLTSYIKYLANEFCYNELIFVIMRKKAGFISVATTKKQLEDIIKPCKPHYNGNEFSECGEYYLKEEELLCWSLASLKAPLNNDAYKRYKELFCEFFPEHCDIFKF